MYTVMEYVIVNTILFTAIPPGGRERESFFFMYTVMEYVIVNTILFTAIPPGGRERKSFFLCTRLWSM